MKQVFCIYAANAHPSGNTIGWLSQDRCDSALDVITKNDIDSIVIILSGGPDEEAQNPTPMKKLMSDYLTEKLKNDGSLRVQIIQTEKNGKNCSEETILMLECIKQMQEEVKVTVVISECNWPRLAVTWFAFSNHKVEIIGPYIERSPKYYFKELLKTGHAVLYGVAYRMGMV